LPDQYPFPLWLASKMPWPPTVNGVRYAEVWEHIRLNRELFRGNHFEPYEKKYERLNGHKELPSDLTHPVSITVALLALQKMPQSGHLQEINLPQALSLLWADLVGGRAPRVSPGSSKGQRDKATDTPDTPEELAMQRLMDEAHGEAQEAIGEQSYTGNGVLVARLEKLPNGSFKSRLVAFPADQWIPWSATGDPKSITAHILLREEKADVNATESILTAEIHYPGMVRYRKYTVGGGQIISALTSEPPPGAPEDQELPKLSYPAVQPFRNIGTPKDFRGISDYDSIDSLCSEFDVRASQWGVLNDRFTAPIMTGPDSVLERNPETGAWDYKTSPDGKYIPRSDKDDPKPEYVVWDPQFQMQLQTWDRLMDAWYVVTGTTPAAFSVFKEGGSGLSGSALRLRMARPLQVAARKRNQLLPALKRALLVAQELEVHYGGAQYQPTMPLIDWPENLPVDPKENSDIESTRKREGLTTTADALMRLDNLSETEAHAKAQEIADEQAANLPAGGLFMPGANLGLNGPGAGGGAPPSGGQGAA
jgi:hypothetical protein